jgi:YHS domain-containing protein
MKIVKIVAAGLGVLAVLGFAGYHAFLYSLGIYATEPVYQTSDGAIDGYDPVAYFTEGQPRKGTPELAHEWNGATWHFASAGNLAAFRENPERYAPQFGGYCAWAVGNNYTARPDPQAWHVEDGKLYLNFSADVQKQWLQNRAALIQSGTANWPAVIKD